MASELKPAATGKQGFPNKARLDSVDALRGAVIVLMALDHVRDFFHADAMLYSPTDLTKTNPILFFTRWITHFCLPVFVFAAGMGAYLWWRQRGHTKEELSVFLLTRSVWFVFLEITVMQLAYNFNFGQRFTILLLILWIFGICMTVMAGLVYLPLTWLSVFSLCTIVFHNLLDGIAVTTPGPAAWAWHLLHQPGVVSIASRSVLITYTLLPWIGVMAAGFCFGKILQQTPEVRRRIMRRLGATALIAFLVLRTLNRYGDPVPWSLQGGAMKTFLSFLNCTKYPASLDFILMTLGPASLVLCSLDQKHFSPKNPLIVFGRVPLFFFVLHFYLIHALSIFFALLRYGGAAMRFAFTPPMSMGGARDLFPPHYGYRLWVTYAVWIAVLGCLYPVCRWYGRMKATSGKSWLSYL